MVRAGGAFEEENAGGAEGFGGADDRAGVAWILQTVEDDYEAGAAEDLLDSPVGRANEGDYALRSLGGSDGLEQRIGEDNDAGIELAESSHTADSETRTTGTSRPLRSASSRR